MAKKTFYHSNPLSCFKTGHDIDYLKWKSEIERNILDNSHKTVNDIFEGTEKKNVHGDCDKEFSENEIYLVILFSLNKENR